MPTNVQEADAFFGATDMTGAEAEELTDESVTTLHAHDFLNLGTSSDGVLFRYTIWGSDFDTKTATSSGCLLDFSSAYARCTSLPNVSQGGYNGLRWGTGKDITLEFYVCVYGNASQDGSFGFGSLTTYYDETYANNTIRFVTNGLDLYAVCSSITTAASTATLISTFTAATYSKKKMKIVWTYGTDAKFYVNDSLVATITTNIPSDNNTLSVHFIGANGGYQYLLGPVLVTQEI